MKPAVVNMQHPAASAARLLTIANAQDILQVSRLTLHRLLQRGAVRTVRIGRSVRISEASLLDFIEAGGDHRATHPIAPAV